MRLIKGKTYYNKPWYNSYRCMMSRYIDAEYVKAVMLNDRLMQGNAEFTLYAQQVETQVNALPSIDIVRCGECRLGGTEDCPMDEIDDEYFCNFGEREGE